MCAVRITSAPIFCSKCMHAHTHQEFRCCCFIRRSLKAGAFVVLSRVRSQVHVFV
jgi:hypothetical protein